MQTLTCDSSPNQWWQRDTRQGSAGRQLQEEDWGQTCSNSQRCSVVVNSMTTTLEYCCTSEKNPALVADDERQCFNLASKCNSNKGCVRQYRLILSVCPKITDVTVPSKVIAGTTATIYLTVAAYPTSSFNHPTLLHQSSGTLTTIYPQISTHTDFIHLTAAYSFTVPSEGKVKLHLDAITPPGGSGCQSAASGEIKERYDMMIVEGMLVERGRWNGSYLCSMHPYDRGSALFPGM